MTSEEQSSNDSPSTHATSSTSPPSTPSQTVSVRILDTLETLDYDRETNTYRGEHDPWIDAPSEVVVRTVAALTDRSPLDLDPLYEVIDGDVLDTLLTSTATRVDPSEVKLTFSFNGYDVTHYSNGVIELTPCTDDGEATTSP